MSPFVLILTFLVFGCIFFIFSIMKKIREIENDEQNTIGSAGQPGPAGPAGPQGPRGEAGDCDCTGQGTTSSNEFRTIAINELGYEIDTLGNIQFNSNVNFNRGVGFRENVEFTNSSNTTFNGDLFMEHGDNTKYFDTLPPGTILAWKWAKDNSNPIPNGWNICDGTNGTPNLQGKFVLGAGNDTSLTNRNVNGTGGAETVTLGINEIPEHKHLSGYYRIFDSMGADIHQNGHSDNWAEGKYGSIRYGPNHNNGDTELDSGRENETFNRKSSSQQGRCDPLARANNCNHNVMQDYSEPKGGGEPHNNMPPFYVLLYIMKLNRYSNTVSNNPYNSASARQSTYSP
jgi:microcystin-dependent protein